MNETRHKHKNGFRVFSLRSFMIAVALVACFFAIFAYQLRRYQRHNTAVANIRNAGAHVYVTDSRGRSTNTAAVTTPTLLSAFKPHPTVVSLVDISDPSLSTNDIRKLIPDLETLFPSCYEAGERYIAIELGGNPNIPVDLVSELRTRLPNFRFVKYTPVPPKTKNAVTIGMTQQKLIETIGGMIYEQRNDWPTDKASTIKMLGSLNAKYTDANGFETWIYFTDDVGIGVLGVDFDANRNVVDVWTDRGIPTSRKLTKNEEMIGGL